MKKLLYISNIAGKHFSYSFSGSAVLACQQLGMDFHAVANRSGATPEDLAQDEQLYGIKLYHIDLVRNPFSLQNITAYKQLVSIIKEGQFEYIHCNTPIGGVLGRLAGKKCGVKKVIYQAHGFHFFKGAPLINRLIYHPIEWLLARWTDAIITINQEDFEAAKKLPIREKQAAYFVHGVGMVPEDYQADHNCRQNKRAELGLGENDIALISMGDLIARKDYSTAIDAIAKANDPRLHYFICGDGPQQNALHQRAKELNIEQQIHFLGYRKDVKELLQASDIFLFTTLQEGLPRSMMEAMASGLPCIATAIRGNTDLITDGKNGLLVPPKDVAGFAEGILRLANDPALCDEMKQQNLNAIKDYDIKRVQKELEAIYQAVL